MSKSVRFSDPWAWVALACDRTPERPKLTAVHVEDGGKILAATDGHRLHVSFLPGPGAARDGDWHWKTREPIGGGDFPKWRQVVLEDGRDYGLDVVGSDVMAILSAGIEANRIRSRSRRYWMVRYPATIPHPDGPVCMNPLLLRDALGGMALGLATMRVLSPTSPVRVDSIADDFGERRMAVVMPIKAVGSIKLEPARFSLDEFLIETAVEKAS